MRVEDPYHLANGVTMLPFAFLGWAARTPVQSFFILALMFASVTYHSLYAFGQAGVGVWFYVADVAFQVCCLMTLVMSSECYEANQELRTLAMSIGFGMLLAIMNLAADSPIRNKKRMMMIACLAHVLHAVYGWWYAQDRDALKIGARSLGYVAFFFVIDEFGVPYGWAMGHLFLIPYIYYFWKSIKMIRESRDSS